MASVALRNRFVHSRARLNLSRILYCMVVSSLLFAAIYYGDLNQLKSPLRRNVLYINMAHRTDRRVSIEQQFKRARIVGTRIEASDFRKNKGILNHCFDRNSSTQTLKCAGQLGCQYSHIRALEHVLSLNWKQAIIFEDDFVWGSHTEPVLFTKVLSTIIREYPAWDVIAVSLNVLNSEPAEGNLTIRIGRKQEAQLMRIRRAQTTHGYMVRSGYIPKLLEVFRNCDVQHSYKVAIDTCWKNLQKADNWYALTPQMGTQARGFSDIEQREVNYRIV